MSEIEPDYAGFKIGDLVVPLNPKSWWKFTCVSLWTEEFKNKAYKTSFTPGMFLAYERSGIGVAHGATLLKVLVGTEICYLWSWDLKKLQHETNTPT